MDKKGPIFSTNVRVQVPKPIEKPHGYVTFSKPPSELTHWVLFFSCDPGTILLTTMPSKRRKRVCKKKKVPAKKRRSTRKSVSVSGQNVVKKLGINSVWRVRTDDEEITAKGHVKSSG